MRIEILANGSGSVGQLQSGLRSLRGDISRTIESFRKVNTRLNNLPGGADNLEPAAAQINVRIKSEEKRGAAVDALIEKTERFLQNTADTDARVAQLVQESREQFFGTYHRLRPPENGLQSWWDQRVKDWNNFWGEAGKVLKSALDGVISFCKEHAVEIAVGTVAIVVGAVIIALTGGTAAAFLPAFLAGLKAAAISAAISSAIGAGCALISGDDPLKVAGDGLANGYMWGGIFFAAGSVFNAIKTSIQGASSAEKSIKAVEKGKVSLETTKAKGNYGEMKMGQISKSAKYDCISNNPVTSLDDPIHHGIDGVYYKSGSSPEFIIGEAKYGTSQLGTSSAGKQMSYEWIQANLEKAVSDPVLREQIRTEMILNPENVGRYLYKTMPDGTVTVTDLANKTIVNLGK